MIDIAGVDPPIVRRLVALMLVLVRFAEDQPKQGHAVALTSGFEQILQFEMGYGISALLILIAKVQRHTNLFSNKIAAEFRSGEDFEDEHERSNALAIFEDVVVAGGHGVQRTGN
jgi:hypothetical protein